MTELWQGDCLELMDKIKSKSIDCIICDLPYGTTECRWDIIIPFEKLWEQYERIIKDNGAIVLFGAEPFASKLRISNLKLYRYDWFWIKNNAGNFAQAPYMPLRNVENICVFSKATIAQNSKNRMIYNPQGVKDSQKKSKGKSATDFRPNRKKQKDYIQRGTGYPRQTLEFRRDTSFIHPTQKPVALLEYLILTYTNGGDVVLDNCMGSGSTGVACKRLKRNFIGIEKDEKYFILAKERIKNETIQMNIFDFIGEKNGRKTDGHL